MLTFSLKLFTLRKITFDNSVKIIAQGEQIREFKQTTIKYNSPPKKQNKKNH